MSLFLDYVTHTSIFMGLKSAFFANVCRICLITVYVNLTVLVGLQVCNMIKWWDHVKYQRSNEQIIIPLKKK